MRRSSKVTRPAPEVRHRRSCVWPCGEVHIATSQPYAVLSHPLFSKCLRWKSVPYTHSVSPHWMNRRPDAAEIGEFATTRPIFGRVRTQKATDRSVPYRAQKVASRTARQSPYGAHAPDAQPLRINARADAIDAKYRTRAADEQQQLSRGSEEIAASSTWQASIRPQRRELRRPGANNLPRRLTPANTGRSTDRS